MQTNQSLRLLYLSLVFKTGIPSFLKSLTEDPSGYGFFKGINKFGETMPLTQHLKALKLLGE